MHTQDVRGLSIRDTARRFDGDRSSRAIQLYYRVVAPFFDAETAGRGDEPFWESLGRRPGVRSVLDLGAGTGRVAALLARGGAQVVAVDLSPEMLARARALVERCPTISLLRADIRSLALGRRFDLVVAADDPFSHMRGDCERQAAIRVAARHLAPGGTFVLDALWWPEPERRAAASLDGRRRTAASRLGDQAMDVREVWRCNATTRRCTATYAYTLDGCPGPEVSFRARYWSPVELRRRLVQAGLTEQQWWGDFARQQWNPRTATRLVVEATAGAPSE